MKEVYCYLLGVAEEFRSILEKEVANLFLVLFVVLRYVFRVYLVAVDSCNRVVRVQHLSQLAEDVLNDIDHKLGINHLAQLVRL